MAAVSTGVAMDAVSWTDTLTAIGSIATAAAFVLAVVVWYQDRQRVLRRQASKIFVLPADRWGTREDDDGEHWWKPFEVTVSNLSDAPIYKALPYVVHPDGRRQNLGIYPVIMPDSESQPAKTARVRAKKEPRDLYLFPDLEVAFTDNAGRSWYRRYDGRLYRLRKWHWWRSRSPKSRWR